MPETFYKGAQPDGWDFYTSKTINYRDAIGTTVTAPGTRTKTLCGPGILHAARDPNGVFAGCKIPLSLYEVTGKPVADDGSKQGFHKLTIVRELDPVTVYKWNYAEAANPVHPFRLPVPAITLELETALKEWGSVWSSIWGLVGNSIGSSIWGLVGNSIWVSVGSSVGNSIWGSVGNSVGSSIWVSVGSSVGNSIWGSVGSSVGNSVGSSIWVSVGSSVGNSVGNSVRGSVGAYTGDLFRPVVPAWKDTYPFAPAVTLWRAGLVPSFDGQTWRLHAGPRGETVHTWKP